VGRCEIDRRLETLTKLQSVVDASTALADAHEAALDNILSSTSAGLRALRTEIDGDTTVEAVREDIRRIFEDFRVYALVARQVWLVKAADTVVVTVARFATTAENLAPTGARVTVTLPVVPPPSPAVEPPRDASAGGDR
jgi:hypothetical protein